MVARKILFALVLLSFAFPFQTAVSQAPNSQSPIASDLTTQTSLVIVPALVRSKSGQLVFNLKASDFALTDDGIPQKLTLEQDTGGDPLAMVVVVEVGGAGAREFDNDKLAPLAPMLENVVGNVPHRIAVVAFDSQPTLVQQFTSDVDAAAKAILDLTPGCSRQHHMENCEAPGSFHDLSTADNGAATLDALGFAVELLRDQPVSYRRAILLVSETIDRGSKLKVDDAVRDLSDTNTAIYSLGFSTGNSEAAHYAYRELPGSHRYPNPPRGCMGKDPVPDPDATHSKTVQAYDCLTQLAPPLAVAKMAAILITDGLHRNVPETVARLTGGEYFKLTDRKSLERSLQTIANQLPNRYVLSFHPPSPHPGFHAIALRLPDYTNLEVTGRRGYWREEFAGPAQPAPESH
jgi:VWFA-related protein